MFKKIVIVTRRTRLQELVERFNTHSQAKFYIEHSGGDFADYEREDDSYQTALDLVRRSLDFELPHQVVDRALVPTYKFQKEDVVVTLGQDGLVANTAKYAGAQPIVAVNPEPSRFDGILLPFLPDQARAAVGQVLDAKAAFREVTLADATLNDGQRLLAFNDLFLGARSHVSALYRIVRGKRSETQSSSGVLVSTGAGSTGWISSVFNMASGVTSFCGGRPVTGIRMPWEDRRLLYVVREPFISRHSQAGIVAGMLETGEELVLESLMPSGGAIFSDGMEADFLQFNSGAIVRVRAAEQRAHLVVS
ncbi:MAG: NAD+ kinase [Terriglobia bacterium]